MHDVKGLSAIYVKERAPRFVGLVLDGEADTNLTMPTASGCRLHAVRRWRSVPKAVLACAKLPMRKYGARRSRVALNRARERRLRRPPGLHEYVGVVEA